MRFLKGKKGFALVTITGILFFCFLSIETFFLHLVLDAFEIPSSSMEPTLKIGDFVLVNKLAYRVSRPERGDIIVFRWPVNPEIDFIKRIIGVPGDHIVIKGQTLYINGKKVQWQFARETHRKLIYYEYLPTSNGKFRKHLVAIYKHPFAPERNVNVIVPPDDYFVMGDNRDNSDDSRYWGFVPRKDIIGEAFMIYFSGHLPPNTGKKGNNSRLADMKQLIFAFVHPRVHRIGIFLTSR